MTLSLASSSIGEQDSRLDEIAHDDAEVSEDMEPMESIE